MDVMARSWLGHHPLTNRRIRIRTDRRVALLLRHVSARGSRRSGVSQSTITRRDTLDDDYDNVRDEGFPRSEETLKFTQSNKYTMVITILISHLIDKLSKFSRLQIY
jgi:hypothetical protein